MKLYRKSAAISVRLKYGRRMTRRLRGFTQSEPLADVLQVSQQALREADHAVTSLTERVEDAADDSAIGEFKAEQKVRRVWNVAKEKDGDRKGTVTNTLFPKGVTSVVRPQGQAQIKAIEDLLVRATQSKIPEVVAALPDILPLIQEAHALYVKPYNTYLAAVEALSKAEAIAKVRGDEHRRTVDALFGHIRALFPGNKAQQELLVPPLPSTSTKRNNNDDQDEDGQDDDQDKNQDDAQNSGPR